MGIFATTTSPTHVHAISTSTALPIAMKLTTSTAFNVYIYTF
jgi:hypothetical protein